MSLLKPRPTTPSGLQRAGDPVASGLPPSFRAGGAAINPDSHLGCGVRAGKGWEGAALAGVPAPAYQVIVGDVIE